MRAVTQPRGNILVGQPPPPTDHQTGLHQIFDDGTGDLNRGPEQKDRLEQGPERRGILVLDGIEPIAVEE